MSQNSIQRWMQSVEAWSAGDQASYLEFVGPDWEFHSSGTFPGLKEVYRGREGAIELWDSMREAWEAFAIDVERVHDLGDRLVALVTFRVRGRDGLETSRPWAYVVTMDGESFTRTDNFSTWEAALEAAGVDK